MTGTSILLEQQIFGADTIQIRSQKGNVAVTMLAHYDNTSYGIFKKGIAHHTPSAQNAPQIIVFSNDTFKFLRFTEDCLCPKYTKTMFVHVSV